jgi:hypothetical protein
MFRTRLCAINIKLNHAHLSVINECALEYIQSIFFVLCYMKLNHAILIVLAEHVLEYMLSMLNNTLTKIFNLKFFTKIISSFYQRLNSAESFWSSFFFNWLRVESIQLIWREKYFSFLLALVKYVISLKSWRKFLFQSFSAFFR